MNAAPAHPALSAIELLNLRMRALGLTAPVPGLAGAGLADTGPTGSGPANSGPDRIAAVARHLLAAQGQDWRSSRWALGRRAPGSTLADVVETFDSGRIVRSWPMRGTIHVTAAEDIGWMQRATGARVLAGAPKRREYLGLEDAMLERMVGITEAALAGGRSLSRDELAALWTEAGIDWKSNWRYHAIWWMCQNGITVFGPVHRRSGDQAVAEAAAKAAAGTAVAPAAADAEPRLVLASEWISHPRTLDGDEALAEIAARHAAARGPVQIRDLSWWTGLTVRDAKRGVALAAEAGRLVPVMVDPGGAGSSDVHSDSGVRGGEYWVDPELLDAGRVAAPAASAGADHLLLPAFDEHLLGYTDRSVQLAPGDLDRVVPGRNGMFLATVVRGGRTVATWKRGPRKAPEILVSPLPGCTVDPQSLEHEARAWAEFHGTPSPAVSIV
ncbi:winged helix DNA-binding domain-containing protein [Leucobacter sp. GX24907]